VERFARTRLERRGIASRWSFGTAVHLRGRLRTTDKETKRRECVRSLEFADYNVAAGSTNSRASLSNC
jgi:hypothetical protein